jgi:sterol desaturase/sphingolipid hydroxylase (fatty acid hydroxylase superfamily)
MNTSLLHTTWLGIFVTFLGSVLFAEFSGYWVHRFLHTDKLPLLSRPHIIHHFLLYGPTQPMRAPVYKDATVGRFSLGNIGLEWILPSSLILLACWAVLYLLHVRALYQFCAVFTLLAWPLLMFSYLHDKMHVSNFWMERVPVIALWFRHARRCHDIHHHTFNDIGRMDANFGIGFFWFDRLFHTYAKRHRPLNWLGYHAAAARYGFDDAKLPSQNAVNKSLLPKTP